MSAADELKDALRRYGCMYNGNLNETENENECDVDIGYKSVLKSFIRQQGLRPIFKTLNSLIMTFCGTTLSIDSENSNTVRNPNNVCRG